MIPSDAGFLDEDFEVGIEPTNTYKMRPEEKLVRGRADGLEAMGQAIYKILLTERYRYAMYSWDYGIELADLFGMPASYVCPELERRITEALTWDDRIDSVDNFEFGFPKKGVVHATFTAHTIFGEVQAEREVEI